MKTLIFLSHPAQFLFYKNSIIELKEMGHQVYILIKTKDILSNLLEEYGLDYYNILPKERGKSRLSIIKSLLIRDIRLFKFARKNKVQLLMGSDASLAHVGYLLHIPCITTIEDDYRIIKQLARLTYPFTSVILSPQICNVDKWYDKKIGYQGYMKLAYLHPSRFFPDESKLNIEKSNPFYIIRLSGLGAHHDYGIKGVSGELLKKVIKILERKGRVYISSENDIKPEFEKYRLRIPSSDIHHYLYYADMLICDSQSMAVEAAMLGTPGIRISSFSGKISVLEELEHTYGLTFGFQPNQEDDIINKIKSLLIQENLEKYFQIQKETMLAEKINVASFLTWFISNYPDSKNVMNKNPDYQFKFK